MLGLAQKDKEEIEFSTIECSTCGCSIDGRGIPSTTIQQSLLRETFSYIQRDTPYQNGLTASLHGGVEENIKHWRTEQWMILNGFRMMDPVEMYHVWRTP